MAPSGNWKAIVVGVKQAKKNEWRFQVEFKQEAKKIRVVCSKDDSKNYEIGSEKSEFRKPVKSYCKSVHMMVIA